MIRIEELRALAQAVYLGSEEVRWYFSLIFLLSICALTRICIYLGNANVTGK